MNKRIFLSAVAFAMAALLLCAVACAPVKPQENERGRTAVLFSSLAQMWREVGGEVDITVGESVERGFAKKDALLVDDGAGKSIHTERLISFGPSLVIYSADIPAQCEAAALLEQSGVQTLACHVETFEDYLACMEKMAALCKNREILSSLQSQRLEVEAFRRAKPFAGKKILFVRAGSTASSTKAKKAEDHFACAMLEELGAENIAENVPLLLQGLSMEEILRADPDFVFFSCMGNETAAIKNINALLARREWSALSAVKSERVIILPKELFHYKPASAWPQAYAYLSQIAGEEK